MRNAVEEGIRDTCTNRQRRLWTLNVRTNHVHAVTSASEKADIMLSALKANATRSMRDAKCWNSDSSPWSHRGSKKYLWNEKELADAIAYVQHGQGEPLK